jgi:hypothetical protein
MWKSFFIWFTFTAWSNYFSLLHQSSSEKWSYPCYSTNQMEILHFFSLLWYHILHDMNM